MGDIQLYTETITTKGTLMLREEDRSRTKRKEFIRAVKGRKSKAPTSQAQGSSESYRHGVDRKGAKVNICLVLIVSTILLS